MEVGAPLGVALSPGQIRRAAPIFQLHNGALTPPLCRSPFSERLFSPIYQSHKTPRYCWPTYFNVLGVLFLGEVSSDFLPSKKASWTLKFRPLGVNQQYPGVNVALGKKYGHDLHLDLMFYPVRCLRFFRSLCSATLTPRYYRTCSPRAGTGRLP